MITAKEKALREIITDKSIALEEQMHQSIKVMENCLDLLLKFNLMDENEIRAEFSGDVMEDILDMYFRRNKMQDDIEENKRIEETRKKMISDANELIHDTKECLEQEKKVYFIKCRDKIKIGRSNSPKRRLQNLKTSNPDKIDLLFTISENVIREDEIHALLKQYSLHIRREWFQYTEDVKYLIAWLKRIKKTR